MERARSRYHCQRRRAEICNCACIWWRNRYSDLETRQVDGHASTSAIGTERTCLPRAVMSAHRGEADSMRIRRCVSCCC